MQDEDYGFLEILGPIVEEAERIDREAEGKPFVLTQNAAYRINSILDCVKSGDIEVEKEFSPALNQFCIYLRGYYFDKDEVDLKRALVMADRYDAAANYDGRITLSLIVNHAAVK